MEIHSNEVCNRMLVDYHQKQWLDWLGTAKFAYNDKVNSLMKVLLFMANNGQNPKMGFELRKRGKVAKTKEFVKRMKKIEEKVQVVLKKAQEKMKKQVDWHRGEPEEYKVRDLVLLSMKDLKWQMVGRRTNKLIEKFIGLYKVKGVISTTR